MSIKEIARIAGVSPATVSRVLNNPDYRCADPGARDRIWAAAIEMNYAPNEAARSLRSGRSAGTKEPHRIRILMTRMDTLHEDPFFAELLHVIESEIHENHCILEKIWHLPVFSDDKKCARINLQEIIDEMHQELSNKEDGLIIIGKCNEKALRMLNRRYRGVISVNRNSTNYQVDEVTCDGRKIAALAVEHLLRLGHRSIGYVGSCYHEARYRGYQETLYQHEIDVEPGFVIETGQTEEEGFAAMRQFMKSIQKPTAIYCANDITAIGMIRCLGQYRNKYYTPSIIASDDIEEAQSVHPMLTTVRLPRDEMGRFAISILLDRLNGGHKSVVRLELEGKLLIRESCRERGE